MTTAEHERIEAAKEAAVDVLRHNARGPFGGLPRAAGWGYPEPYTRDLMIASLGILVSRRPELVASLGRVLKTLARHQTSRGHIPSLVHEPGDLGASDTTPLFLIGVALFRKVSGDDAFLEEAVQRGIAWMSYQAPDDLIMVAQQPTSDWRDEQWVAGYGLYVNTLVYTYLRLFGLDDQAARLRQMVHRFDVRGGKRNRHIHEGLAVRHKPYFALWSYKAYNSERFDLLGNSLAILCGLASPTRAKELVSWIEAECAALRQKGDLAGGLPPCLFPYIRPQDPDWRPRYAEYNPPGEYHNGGVWPFVCGFYVAALVAAGRPQLARRTFHALTELVRPACDHSVEYGFNEWFRAQDGTPGGEDWQTWSAAMYLYAAACIEQGSTPFFDQVRALPASAKGPGDVS